ncbi:1-phosphofructokinase [Inconstantimicrobium mannanitabidum]|uniref:Tagatose-6-phosphate kinase n=1 Tax=Inconstantimicrobium mannanitabidum TaxID=1604901 RepID=A0ACB5RCE7_9CLOT|nr:1-phosphofructokinase [Clostridium sp. TW13]GKX66929.1 tagatose-6-phosphate kinase [Clostridium sp. TW13]
MIYTLTLNPSIDYIVNVEKFTIGSVNRTNFEEKYPGGKGINVSRVLFNQGIANRALGFVGGFTGDFIESSLKKIGLETDFIHVNGDSRINIKLKSDDESEINGLGPEISQENIKAFYSKLDELNDGDILVLAGSIPSTLDKEIYSQIFEYLKGKGVKIVVDTTGKAFIDTLKYGPFLVKPNNHELEEMFNVKINSQEELIQYGKKVLDMGAQNVIISLAGEGALMINKDGVYRATAPKGTVKNSVGAGDSLIGGFLAEYSRSGDLQQAFKSGIASGSATAFSLDIATKEESENLYPQITITEVK